MGMIGTFVAGAVTGAAVMYFYGQRLGIFIDERTGTARARAAQTLGSAADKLGAASVALDMARGRVEGGLTGKREDEPAARR